MLYYIIAFYMLYKCSVDCLYKIIIDLYTVYMYVEDEDLWLLHQQWRISRIFYTIFTVDFLI